MKSKKNAQESVDQYILSFPKNIQNLLKEMRKIITKAAPDAEEVISYQMPAYKYNGILVYFAAFKNHIGFFPTSSGIKKFRDELTGFKTSKGTVQFPFDKQLPAELIRKIVLFRLMENESS